MGCAIYWDCGCGGCGCGWLVRGPWRSGRRCVPVLLVTFLLAIVSIVRQCRRLPCFSSQSGQRLLPGTARFLQSGHIATSFRC